MALTGVLRPGHAQVRVLDLEEAVTFYRDVLGLVETGRDAQGRVYFKCWDERDHHSYVIRQADRAGLDHFAFRVLDKATLEKFDADLQAYGLKTERIPAGEMLETIDLAGDKEKIKADAMQNDPCKKHPETCICVAETEEEKPHTPGDHTQCDHPFYTEPPEKERDQ